MGTKALNGPDHQRLLWNPKFPPASATGECQPALSNTTDWNDKTIRLGQNANGTTAKLKFADTTWLDEELIKALKTKSFIIYLRASASD